MIRNCYNCIIGNMPGIIHSRSLAARRPPVYGTGSGQESHDFCMPPRMGHTESVISLVILESRIRSLLQQQLTDIEAPPGCCQHQR